jgi:hypothetical protein
VLLRLLLKAFCRKKPIPNKRRIFLVARMK